MIVFKHIKYKNFLSTGNSPIQIQLDRTPTTLITGHNGAGKTTILEALIYCLYGKPYRKVKVANLINNINKKKLETEVVFEYQNSTYKILRYQKPAKFEIYKDDELIDQNSTAKEYQQVINKIFGDYKLFTQTVILNKSKFIPFLSLSTTDRRKIVDDMLDINIFSQMNKIAKDILSKAKHKIIDCEYNKDKVDSKISLTENTLKDLKSNDDSITENFKSAIQSIEKEIEIKTKELPELLKDDRSLLEPEDKLKEKNSEKQKIKNEASNIIKDIKRNEKEINFYSDNSDCPTCKQHIDEKIKEDIIEKLNKENENYKELLNEKKNEVIEIDNEIENLESDLKLKNEWENEKSELEREIYQLENQLSVQKSNLDSVESKQNSSIKKQEDILEDLKSEKIDVDKTLKTALENKEVVETLVNSLKDDGVKTRIIDMYIPILNEKINEYLELMEFYIGVELDETFNEVFTAAGREGFTYHNLSDGQKSRLDLAILLSWLHVAELKASIHTNLLFLDEILSAVDYDGINCFMNLIRTQFGNKNLFVIEQRQDLTDNFRSHIDFKLVNGFTEIV